MEKYASTVQAVAILGDFSFSFSTSYSSRDHWVQARSSVFFWDLFVLPVSPPFVLSVHKILQSVMIVVVVLM